MDETDRQALAARADMSRFLAACYYEPEAQFAEEALFESLRAAAARIDCALADGAGRLGEAFAALPLQDLLIDYTRLFLGPVDARARPYGSVWLDPDRLPMKDATMAVLALYEEGGFEVAEDFRELPDHIAAELEFLYLLLFRENQALAGGDVAERERHAALRRRLLDEHLLRFAAPFAQALQSGAQTAFYRELGALTDAFVRSEAARLANP